MPSNIDFLHGSVLGVSSLTVGGAFEKLILELRIQLSFQVHLEELIDCSTICYFKRCQSYWNS